MVRLLTSTGVGIFLADFFLFWVTDFLDDFLLDVLDGFLDSIVMLASLVGSACKHVQVLNEYHEGSQQERMEKSCIIYYLCEYLTQLVPYKHVLPTYESP